MIGAIAGDIIGSRYEGSRATSADFPLFQANSHFTDDTVCTLAVANAILLRRDFSSELRRLCRAYPNAGYGGMFRRWVRSDDEPAYGSWGNGAPMRTSPVGWMAGSLEEVDALAEAQAAVSHSHPDAVESAKVISRAIFLLSHGWEPEALCQEFERKNGYDLSPQGVKGRPKFDITAKGTAQTALCIALRSASYEGAIREAVLLGGDTDTLACIVGSVAEARHGVPEGINSSARRRLPPDLLDILHRFEERRLISC